MYCAGRVARNGTTETIVDLVTDSSCTVLQFGALIRLLVILTRIKSSFYFVSASPISCPYYNVHIHV